MLPIRACVPRIQRRASIDTPVPLTRRGLRGTTKLDLRHYQQGKPGPARPIHRPPTLSWPSLIVTGVLVLSVSAFTATWLVMFFKIGTRGWF